MTTELIVEPQPQVIGDRRYIDGWDDGEPRNCVGTVFPYDEVVIVGPGVHAIQKMDYIERLDEQRRTAGLKRLNEEQVRHKIESAVDLILLNGVVYIRPNPEQMVLAFAADEVLQKVVPKHRVKYLYLNNVDIRRAVEERGECWRINLLPKSTQEIVEMIRSSRIAIRAREMYYYNMRTGARYLTYGDFEQLGSLPIEELSACLREVRDHCLRRNRQGHAEVKFFQADAERFGEADMEPLDVAWDDARQVRQAYDRLRERFREAVPETYRRDSIDNLEWRNAMVAALASSEETEVSEARLLGLSSEYFMKVFWLPGARFEEGELIFDPVYDQCDDEPAESLAHNLCYDGPRIREFVFNAYRRHHDMTSVNIGRVEEPLSGRRDIAGRRGVYLMVVRVAARRDPIIKVIRMQKWDAWEYLDEGKDMGAAMLMSAEYTSYILDRHLGCRQLGMRVAPVTPARLSEIYAGFNANYRDVRIWSTYLERDYIKGCSTEKLPTWRLRRPEYAHRLARLLGEAAAPDIIVGRVSRNYEPYFDAGDEIVHEKGGLPTRILVGDFTGSFADYMSPLGHYASHYASVVNRRLPHVSDPRRFVNEYLLAFEERFEMIQEKYRRRQRAFDSLFTHRDYDPNGSMPYRWSTVLKRLMDTEATGLAGEIRRHVDL